MSTTSDSWLRILTCVALIAPGCTPEDSGGAGAATGTATGAATGATTGTATGTSTGTATGASTGAPTGNVSGFDEPPPINVGETGLPANLGTETSCDGIDDNQNGIVDDVDAGNDGLCDCLNIGFLGAFASDAGTMTGAFEAWLEARSNIPVVTIPATGVVTAEVLSGLQVLVVGNLTERVAGGFTAAEIAAIQAWIEVEGNGLMTLAGYTATESHMAPTAQILAPLGVGYDYVGRGSGVLGTGAPPVRVVGFPNPAHPTVEGVDAIGVYYAYPVMGDGEVVATQGGFDLAMTKTFGAGRVVVFGDEWITQDSLWMPDTNTNLTPCQQQCRQCADQCGQCATQCTTCRTEPCTGNVEPDENGDCPRGCNQACEMCTDTCDTCTAACDTCMVAEPELDIPRFWLDVLRWLTPANECQVTIPPIIR